MNGHRDSNKSDSRAICADDTADSPKQAHPWNPSADCDGYTGTTTHHDDESAVSMTKTGRSISISSSLTTSLILEPPLITIPSEKSGISTVNKNKTQLMRSKPTQTLRVDAE